MRYAGLFALFLGVFCGSAIGLAKKPKSPPDEPAAAGKSPARTQDDTMQVEGTVGEMDSSKVEQLFREHQPELRRCYDDEAKTLHYLGGRMELKIRVLPSGEPRAISVVDSSIGSLEVERCVTALIAKWRFPAPKGGEGEVTYPFDCAARTPVGSWQSARIAAVLTKKRSALRGCAGRAQALSKLRATLYIGPGGKATSVGFSAEGPLDDKLTRCVAKQLLSAQYDDPLGQMVKVSYDVFEP